MVHYGFTEDGGFAVVRHDYRRASYSYRTSPNEVRARRNPALTARFIALGIGQCPRGFESIELELYNQVCAQLTGRAIALAEVTVAQ